MESSHLRGNDHPNSKLTAASVRSIRKLHAKGMSYGRLGERFGVSKMTIRRVILRQSWAHLDQEEDQRATA